MIQTHDNLDLDSALEVINVLRVGCYEGKHATGLSDRNVVGVRIIKLVLVGPTNFTSVLV